MVGEEGFEERHEEEGIQSFYQGRVSSTLNATIDINAQMAGELGFEW